MSRWGNSRAYWWPTLTKESRDAWDRWQESARANPLDVETNAELAAAYFAALGREAEIAATLRVDY